ncbi:MAG TPA: hypothetical protein VE442_10500, partial [Jatrophihabitans sp.]|nr:hypothetical protein [Jatrophihabitans sp.]
MAAAAFAVSAATALAVTAANAVPNPHAHGGPPSISSSPWGTFGGQQVDLYSLSSGHGMTVKITNFGATVQSIW